MTLSNVVIPIFQSSVTNTRGSLEAEKVGAEANNRLVADRGKEREKGKLNFGVKGMSTRRVCRQKRGKRPCNLQCVLIFKF